MKKMKLDEALADFKQKNKAVKADEGKLRYDLIPPEALEDLARVLTYGANKYTDNNWQQGLKWSRVFASLMRHMWAWWRGQDLDEESGLPHLAHAACNVFFLSTYSYSHPELDDRPK